MANKRISELDSAVSLDDSDLIEISESIGGGYVSKKILASLVRSYCQKYRTIIFTLAVEEDAFIGTNKAPSFIMPTDGVINKAIAYARTAPTGADLVFDINKNGSTIWTTQANRLKITAGSNTGSQTSFDIVNLFEGDRIDIDLDSVGSIIPGSNITVEIRIAT